MRKGRGGKQFELTCNYHSEPNTGRISLQFTSVDAPTLGDFFSSVFEA